MTPALYGLNYNFVVIKQYKALSIHLKGDTQALKASRGHRSFGIRTFALPQLQSHTQHCGILERSHNLPPMRCTRDFEAYVTWATFSNHLSGMALVYQVSHELV
jgi:hypothetical protein